MAKNNNYFLVRHGKTTSNEEGIFMGTLDIPLSPNGIQEALALHKQIKEMRFSIAYSSPLSRALDTAYLVLGMANPVGKEGVDYPLSFYPNDQIVFNIPLLIEPRIAERSFGDLLGVVKEGYTKEQRFAKYAGRNVTKSFHDKADGGESFRDLEVRLTNLFEELEQKHQGERILIFSHNGPIRVMRKYFENLSEEKTLKLSNPHCQLICY